MKKVSISKIVLIVWLVFTTLYLVYGEYSRLTGFVAQTAYNQGYRDSATQLVAEVTKCQPVPITLGTQTVSVIGLECLQKAAEANASTPEVPNGDTAK